MHVTMYPGLRCQVYQMDGGEFDPLDAIWVPMNTLGEYSLFIGGSYPIVKPMPPSVHNADDLPFMKHGCVFIAHHRINILNAPIPNLCHFILDESPSWGATLKSCNDMNSRCPPLWIVPSMKNTWDQNYEVDMQRSDSEYAEYGRM